MDVDVVVTRGLGDNTYVLRSGREAAVVDPQRDAGRFAEVAAAHEAEIVAVLETHVHNDYVSGAPDLAERTGADLVVPAGAGYAFVAREVREGDEVRVGSIRLVALHTPGHTPEHLSYAVYPEGAGAPAGIFTGGSLMVSGAGRTDLLGPELTDRLTRDQFRTVRRLASFPDDVWIFPTHGAGSFCGAGPAPRHRTATLGDMRGHNPALDASDEGAFVRRQLSGLLSYPAYYRHMAPINRRRRAPFDDASPPRSLRPEEVDALLGEGAWLVDGRPRDAFARAHVPGSLNVELEDDFASYAGWVLPFLDPLVLLVPQPEDESVREAVTQLLRIGFDSVRGWLAGGIEAWVASGRGVVSYPTADVEDLCRELKSGRSAPPVLDVRQRVEWDRGHIPGSTHVFVGDLPERLADLPLGGEVWAICATGHRASLAASLMDRSSIPIRLVSRGGVEDWLRLCGP